MDLNLRTSEEVWISNFEKVKQYININNKRPSKYDQNSEIKKLGMWMTKQNNNYIKKINIMKNETIYNNWTEFLNNYNQYFN